MKKALVVGSGAGGATAARELQGIYDVTILEAGKEFRPLALSLRFPETLKRLRLLFDERQIPLIFPAMKIRKTEDRMVLVRGIGTGGTTTLATANALRQDDDLKKMGYDLDEEFAELSREIPISIDHQKRWRPATRRLFSLSTEMGLAPRPMPKMIDDLRCRGCGRCILGCPSGAKWDSRKFIHDSLARGGHLVTGCRAEKMVFENDRVSGVLARIGRRREFIPADVVVLAAGGLGTPAILQNSGIPCEPRLSVDPVLCVAAEWENCFQNKEIPMPFVVQREHFILSPYFDLLSYFFNGKWHAPASSIISLMIKLADANCGSIEGDRVHKTLSTRDRERLNGAVGLCTDILTAMGVRKEKIFLGTVNAGHPSGMLPLTRAEVQTLHSPRLPANLYVADASLLPFALGNPPILTIMALAKKICKKIKIQ